MTVRVESLDRQGNPNGVTFTALLVPFMVDYLSHLSVLELADIRETLKAGRHAYASGEHNPSWRLTPTRL